MLTPESAVESATSVPPRHGIHSAPLAGTNCVVDVTGRELKQRGARTSPPVIRPVLSMNRMYTILHPCSQRNRCIPFVKLRLLRRAVSVFNPTCQFMQALLKPALNLQSPKRPKANLSKRPNVDVDTPGSWCKRVRTTTTSRSRG